MAPLSEGRGGQLGQVLRNSAALGLAQVLERATTLVIALVIAHRLGAAAFGLYSVALAYYGLITTIGETGVRNYFGREVSRDPRRTAEYLLHLGVLAVGFAIPVLLAAQVAIRTFGYSAELETSITIILLAVVPRVVNGLLETLFITVARVVLVTLTRLGASVAYVLAGAYLVFDGAGIPALLAVFVACEYLVLVVYLVLAGRFVTRLRATFRWRLAVRLLRDLRPFLASSVLAALWSRPEVLLLSALATETQVGLYSAAMRIAELPLLLPEVTMTNVFPLLSRAFKAAEERYLALQRAAVRGMLAFSLPVAAVLIGGAEPIVRLVFGEDFAGAAPMLAILALNVISYSLIAVFYRSLIARYRQTTDLAIHSVMVVLRLGLGALLIGRFAGVGAAIASAGVSALYMLLLARATTRSGAPVRLWATSWRFAVAAAAAGAAVWLLAPLFLGAGLVAAAVVYVGAALALGAIRAEDRALLRRVRASATRVA